MSNRQWNLALPIPPPQSALLAGRGITSPAIISNAELARFEAGKPVAKERSWLNRNFSEIIWALWFALGIGWELYCVFTEARTGQEPLTRILRDRLMRRGGYIGRITTLSFIVFMAWLIPHFLLP